MLVQGWGSPSSHSALPWAQPGRQALPSCWPGQQPGGHLQHSAGRPREAWHPGCPEEAGRGATQAAPPVCKCWLPGAACGSPARQVTRLPGGAGWAGLRGSWPPSFACSEAAPEGFPGRTPVQCPLPHPAPPTSSLAGSSWVTGHLDLGAARPLDLLCSLMGRSAGTAAWPNGAGINFPALLWGGCNRKLPSLAEGYI